MIGKYSIKSRKTSNYNWTDIDSNYIKPILYYMTNTEDINS